MIKFRAALQICFFSLLMPVVFCLPAQPADETASQTIDGNTIAQPASPATSSTRLAADLEQLFQSAKERNLTLKMERLMAEEQAFDEKKADNAMIPNLDATIAHQRQAYVDATPYTAFFGNQYHTNVYSLQLVQRFPGLGKVPKLQREISRMRTDYQNVICLRAVIEMERELTKLFFDLVQERELARIDDENIRLLEKLLEVAIINRDVGLALPNDILRIEAEKANLESSLTTRHFQQENLCIDIATMLDLPGPDLRVKLPVSLVYPLAQPDFEKLQAAMMANDFDLQLARRDCELVRLALDMSQAARKPTLSVNGKYNWTTTSIGQNNARDYTMGLALEVPVYDSGDLKNEVLRTERTYERTQLALERLTSLKRAALNKAWTDYREMQPKLKYAHKAVEQSLENMRMVIIRYQHGDATIVELVDARLTMSLAAMNAVKNHRDERVRLAELYLLSRDESALKSLDHGPIPVPRVDLIAMMKEAESGGTISLPEVPSLDAPMSHMKTTMNGLPGREALEAALNESPVMMQAVLRTLETTMTSQTAKTPNSPAKHSPDGSGTRKTSIDELRAKVKSQGGKR